MKKIAFLTILIFIAGLMISCNDSSSKDSFTGYIDPGNWTGMTTVNKSYNLANTGFANCTVAGPTCLAVIYEGALGVGIGIKNGSNNLKIYWTGSTIANGAFPCTINLNGTTTSDTITITGLTDNANGTYTFTISFTTSTISGPITAIKA